MTTMTNDNGGSKLLFLLIGLLFLIGLSVVSYSLNFENIMDLPSLSDLPMTQHAAQGRAGTTMDAETIRKMIDDRACRPIEFYVCSPVNQSKAMCYLKTIVNSEGLSDELWAGVIVGLHTPNKIITGYVAPYFEYWVPANARDGCWLASRIN